MGITIFCIYQKSNSSNNALLLSSTTSVENLLIGLLLIVLNLAFDGISSNEQDLLFTKYKCSSYQLMQYIDFYQSICLLIILISGFIINKYTSDSESELILALEDIYNENNIPKETQVKHSFFCLPTPICGILHQIDSTHTQTR